MSLLYRFMNPLDTWKQEVENHSSISHGLIDGDKVIKRLYFIIIVRRLICWEIKTLSLNGTSKKKKKLLSVVVRPGQRGGSKMNETMWLKRATRSLSHKSSWLWGFIVACSTREEEHGVEVGVKQWVNGEEAKLKR